MLNERRVNDGDDINEFEDDNVFVCEDERMVKCEVFIGILVELYDWDSVDFVFCGSNVCVIVDNDVICIRFEVGV